MALTLMLSPRLKGTKWSMRVDIPLLNKRIHQLFAASGCPEDAEGTVLLTNDAEIHELNRTWRHVDKPTDVLSFALQEGEDAEFAGDLLGDVVISVETAARQADSQEHRGRVEGDAPGQWNLQDELTFLIVHGLLHLLGHDHAEPEEEALMRSEERRLWASLGDRDAS